MIASRTLTHLTGRTLPPDNKLTFRSVLCVLCLSIHCFIFDCRFNYRNCTLDIELGYTDNMLTMDFDVGTLEPSLWNVWIVAFGKGIPYCVDNYVGTTDRGGGLWWSSCHTHEITDTLKPLYHSRGNTGVRRIHDYPKPDLNYNETSFGIVAETETQAETLGTWV